jgi:type II secretory pathway pseudopilin PulG
MINKKAQVWIESVLYTLVGLSIIAVLLIATRPQITKTQDEFVIQQTVKAMHELDNKVIEIKQATGNRRIVSFQLSKGDLTFDATNDKIYWELRGTKIQFSEPGYETSIGNIKIFTARQGDSYDVKLTLDYSTSTETTIDRMEGTRVLTPAKTPYSILLENYGPDLNTGLIIVDFGLS